MKTLQQDVFYEKDHDNNLDQKNNNAHRTETILETSDWISEKVDTIIIMDEENIEKMINCTITNLWLTHKKITSALTKELSMYLNNTTKFHYDKNTQEITSVMLEETDLHKLYKELITAIVNEMYIEDEMVLEERKLKLLNSIDNINSKIAELEENIIYLQKHLFQMHHHARNLEQIHERANENELYISSLANQINEYGNNQEELQSSKRELLFTIKNIDNSLLVLSDKKKVEIIKESTYMIETYLDCLSSSNSQDEESFSKSSNIKQQNIMQNILKLFKKKKVMKSFK